MRYFISSEFFYAFTKWFPVELILEWDEEKDDKYRPLQILC